jgi:hypothetical protein
MALSGNQICPDFWYGVEAADVLEGIEAGKRMKGVGNARQTQIVFFYKKKIFQFTVRIPIL